MSLGWGYIPPIPVPRVPTTTTTAEENIETINLVTTRASAPSLGDFLAELHNSEVLSDITICSEDGQAIKCHKLVLIRWSAPFRRMLCGDMREAREKHITLHGVDGDVLAAFIRFLYTCNCSIAPEKLVGLCAMADQYDITLLQSLCMDAIRMHATNHRCCCLFYKAAKDIQQPEIQQLAWEQLSSNLHSLVQQHDVFVQLELEDVLRLFRGPEDTSTAAAAGAEGDAAAGGGGGGVITGPHGLSAGGGAGAAGSSSSPGGGVAAGAGAAGSSSGVTAVSGSLRWWGSNPSTSRSTGSVANRLAAAGGTGAEPLGIYLLGEHPGDAEQPTAAAATGAGPAAAQQQPGDPWLSRGSSRSNRSTTTTTTTLQQPPRRPEYALFLACMAWLHHIPERQQYKQQLYECFDFDVMRDNELSQMRRNPHVQADPELKEMLLDAFERRCMAHAQQPVYHMAPVEPIGPIWTGGEIRWGPRPE